MSKAPVDKGEVMFAILALDGADHHAMANLTRRLWSEIETHRADLLAAAGELPVAMPKPGSVTAKLLRANVMMRRERDDALAKVRAEEREACAKSLHAKAEALRAEADAAIPRQRGAGELKAMGRARALYTAARIWDECADQIRARSGV